MLPNTDDTRDVRAIVMSLAAEAESLDAHVRRLRGEISAVDARLDAVHESLRGLPGASLPGPDAIDGVKNAASPSVD
ncbi:hypothetical protein ABZZ36_14305 [Actinacidiphila glaucinigra]|uniref:hypothetical protein n=1 Tax=Actinacidiphila glaucinigra TaxID=235986 RepID=UPI0033B79AA0